MGLDKGAHSSDLLDDYGTLVGVDGALARLSEEHGVLRIPPDSPLAIGDRIRIVPNHVCTVTNLGRRFYGLRGDTRQRGHHDRRGRRGPLTSGRSTRPSDGRTGRPPSTAKAPPMSTASTPTAAAVGSS